VNARVRLGILWSLALLLTAGGSGAPAAHARATPKPAHSARPPRTPSPARSAAPAAPRVTEDAPIAAIGRLERNRTTPPSALIEYLDASDPAVAARAAIAAGRLRRSTAVPMLVAALQGRRAGNGHGAVARPGAVRAAAAFALGVIASADAQAALIAATHDADPDVVAAAADALGRIGGEDVIGPLTALLGSSHALIRGKAAVGLAEAAFPNAPQLDIAHRQVAARALAAAVAVENDAEAKWRMAWAIARTYPAEDTGALQQLLTDPQELVRVFALKGFAKLKDRHYADAVRLLAKDPAWRVRVEVRNTLAVFNDPTEIDVKPLPVPKSDSVLPKSLPPGSPVGAHPQVAIVTNKGVIVLELFPELAPYNVENFLRLTERGFYNNLRYFRVIPDFVVQGGDPTNKGSGGPGYTVPAELNPLEQLTGVIALGLDYEGNKPRLDSGGSQYYITQSPQLHLDEAFSTFGRVVKGMAVVDAIAAHDQDDSAHPSDVALRVYRCEPVSDQSARSERALRFNEIGFQAE
jgi:peptidyl-prolyl cis-trans isomerase B (cyclophilin B)